MRIKMTKHIYKKKGKKVHTVEDEVLVKVKVADSLAKGLDGHLGLEGPHKGFFVHL